MKARLAVYWDLLTMTLLIGFVLSPFCHAQDANVKHTVATANAADTSGRQSHSESSYRSETSGHPIARYRPMSDVGLQGGLIVQLGGQDTTSAAELSLTGRYLIHLLDPDEATTGTAQQSIRANGRYGLAWAEQARDLQRLPYSENLVNLIVLCDYSVPATELLRVLTPGGCVLIANQALLDRSEFGIKGFSPPEHVGDRIIVRKLRPAEMDHWSHPRHAADGNAVSLDTMVGPPERIRWIAAATSEVEGMVTAGGRNFYGGVMARDSFNGLRLWHRDLTKADEINPIEFELPRLSANVSRPIASDKWLFASLKNQLVALDAATGDVSNKFAKVKIPRAFLFDGFRIIAADDDSVRAFDAKSGEQLWSVPISEPRNVIADGEVIALLYGRVKRGEKATVVVLDAKTGERKWTRDDYPWLIRTTRTVLGSGQLVFEVSTLSDHDDGNALHVVSAADGEHEWSKEYAPAMNHARQARAMFLKDDLWILHGGKVNTDEKEKLARIQPQISALDPLTGEVRRTLNAGLTHCFPPVATARYMFAGELDMTDLQSGEVIANRITKANCSRESGWIPANGLVYTTPKHCTCWPMLRGFVAMASETTGETVANRPLDQIDFLLEKGPAEPDPYAAETEPDDWPLYRHDRWRSASTVSAGPNVLDQKWTARLMDELQPEAKVSGPILHDWKDNPVVKGPLSAPTIADGTAFVTRPNAHELIAIDTASGSVRWRFTANGRLDTPPAIHRGLCLFGSAAGWVYALRADNGELVWRMRAAPTDERIVVCGQVESPWPVPGAVLVMDEIAYFAAGRQPLADGGIFVFAVDPMTGKRHWVKRVDSVPQKGFYENSGLEFDPFDILHAEGDQLAMSRWILSLDGKNIDVDKWNAFAKMNTGDGDAWVPRGSWTYGARHQDRFPGEAPRRPLVVFRDDNVYSSLDGSTEIFRRDFNLEKGDQFDSKWITGWEAGKTARAGGKPYRNHRIAVDSLWIKDPFTAPDEVRKEPAIGTQLHNDIHAMALAGDGRLYVVHRDGRLKVVSTETGYVEKETLVPPPAWDGLAIAGKCVYLTTQDGRLICLGE
ncbi:outer membrane protein assembly factor BamB family protein [Novipirellula artificiosorum]|uniref:Outer membrane biogenesis protein BamB n=1 Tax=Novipirellula artificiosorum TaxID=2528016 RepID=A0A5C6DPV8_9BACT|nr:PQQ-binding-like beta-propeller repeat protein [Novipirellula artificiosorum]TWU38265.1 outer membrane biogenesis protein BamB [Novipirellula artificiosorum]